MAKLGKGSLLAGASGKLGGLVLVQNNGETILRESPRAANPDTPAQQEVRGNLANAARFYQTLTPEQLRAWQDYARKQWKANPGTKTKNGYLAYSALAIKFLQMHPQGSPPPNPPAAAFFGDGVVVTAQTEPGSLRFTASRANAPYIVTELLFQRLASPARTPQISYYRSQAFVPFAPGILDFDLPVEPGFYAPAYRFVQAETGQEAGIAVLPVVVVA